MQPGGQRPQGEGTGELVQRDAVPARLAQGFQDPRQPQHPAARQDVAVGRVDLREGVEPGDDLGERVLGFRDS